MNYLSSTAVKVILAVLLFVLIRAVVSTVALSSFSAIFIDAEFSRDSVVEVFYAASQSIGFRPQFRKTSGTISPNQRADTRIMLSNHVVRRLRVDTGTGPAVVKIYSIRLLSRFGPGMTFDFRQIFERFTPNEAITSFTLEKDHVLIKTDGLDPYLVLKDPLVQRNRALEYGLPFAFALFSYLLLRRFSPGRIAAIGDITAKQSSSGINIGSLDGVRGLAALLVLGQHSGLTATGGIFGVWLFFCLSGFLLATPFVKQPGLALSGTYMADYLTRRIKRIVPMYYVMIVITFLFAGKIEVAVRHVLFIQADGHFWSIPQEMFFYLLLPLVMIANYVIARKNLLLSTLVLALTAFFASSLLTRDVIALYGNNAIQKAQAGIFITGSTAAFLYSLLIGKYRAFFSKPAVRWTSSTCGLLILGVCLALSATKHGNYGHLTPTEKPFYFGIGAGLLILSTLLAKGSYLDKLMNLLPLRAVGVVGYSFYLLHPAMIDSVRSATVYFADYYPVRTGLFILAGIATYVVSIFTYSYIERPFIKK